MSVNPLKSTLLALVAALLCGAAAAQTGPLKLLIGFPAGGSADGVARAVADKVSATLGIPVIVENKPGAGGRIAAELLKNAAADRNTVLVTPLAPVLLAPLSFRKLNFNPETDFVPVAQLAKFQIALTTGATSPHKTLAELVAWFKANPGKANYGTSAAGSQLHFLGVMLSQAIGLELTHVPYQGGAPLIIDVIGGQIPAAIDTFSVELHKAGKVRLLATSGAARSTLVPDVPTFKEQGYPSVVGEGWMGAYMHIRTPATILQRISEALADAARQADIKPKLEAVGLEPTGLKAAEFAAVIAADRARWKPVVEASGFRGDSILHARDRVNDDATHDAGRHRPRQGHAAGQIFARQTRRRLLVRVGHQLAPARQQLRRRECGRQRRDCPGRACPDARRAREHPRHPAQRRRRSVRRGAGAELSRRHGRLRRLQRCLGRILR